jgi:hypothetical protein
MNTINPIILTLMFVMFAVSSPDDTANKPLVVKHKESGYLVYVETNREVLTVVSPDGNIIISENIIKQVLTKEKNGRPAKIDGIADCDWKELTKESQPKDIHGNPLEKGFYIWITFRETRETGLVDLKNGTYHYRGNL